jgi:type VI secretion system protein ImpG
MALDRYYEEELRHLTEAGREFAEKHPERAAFLRLDSQDRDPYVERLLEGFAYVAARIRERLDDDFPEFTRGLFEVLFPHYVRPLPSMAMVQFQPRRGALQETRTLARGLSVYSTPAGREGVSCRFTTAAAVRLHPLSLEEARLERTPQGRHVIRLRFAFERSVDPRRLELDPLPLYLHGESTLTATLHLALTRHAGVVRLAAAGGTEEPVELSGAEALVPGGFREEEALLPYSLRSFPGFRHLHEYFAFRERFLAVELRGLSRLAFAPNVPGFEVECLLDRDYPEEKRFAADNFRLFCAPVVNLFPLDPEPIPARSETLEYPVVADARYPTSLEVYAIERITGVSERRRRTYRPFFGFGHETAGLDVEATHSGRTDPREPAGTFVVRQRLGATGRWHTSVRLNRAAEGLLAGEEETLSLNGWCTNGMIPRDLGENSVTVPGPDFPEFARFTNLTRPTAACYPPEGQELEWRLIAHLALNQRSITSLESLRSVLELYDWSGSAASRRRIAGIRRLELEPDAAVWRGALVRGTRARLELAEEHFTDRADAYLFGLVLTRFLQLYATVNSYVKAVVDTVPSGDHYEWPAMPGEITLL